VNDIMTLNSPKDWKLHRLGQLFRERKEKGSDKDFAPLSVTMRGIVPQLESAAKSDDGDNRKVVRVGDYAINSRSDRKGSGGISDHEGSVSLISIVLQPRDIDRRFSHHLLRSPAFQEEFYRWGHGIVADLWTTRYSDMKNIRLRVPDLPTQREIADFLDRETARIDSLIEKKQRLVELLGEKKETLRDTAVCKGLSGDIDTKDSEVDWFGDVPAHWVVCRFNRLIGSKVDYRGRTPEKVDDGIFLVTARNIREGKIDYQRSKEYTTQEDWEKLSARGKPHIGDVVFTTEAPLGQIAQVDRTDVAFAQRIMKFRANDAFVSNDFLTEFMMSASFQRSLQLYSSGSTAAGIKSERLAHLYGLVPPQNEQSEIVKFVRNGIERLGFLQTPLSTSIDRLKEYRSALITSAVTGQIDVSTYAGSGTTDRQLDAIQSEMPA
jgi:type I restriction enzyme S subunit